MNDTPKDIKEAVARGYPTANQRKTWSRYAWAQYDMEMTEKERQQREEHEAGNSNDRLRELITALEDRCASLERRVEMLEGAAG